jgi:hypothetical protein
VSDYDKETLDAILEAFTVKSDVAYVAATTGLEEQVVRDVLASPETALHAMRYKAAARSVWLYGAIFDILDDMVRNGEGKEQIQAIKLFREFIKEIPSQPTPTPKPLPKPVPQLPAEQEDQPVEVVDVEAEVVRVEELLLDG